MGGAERHSLLCAVGRKRGITMLDEQKILDAIKSALADGGIETVKETCNEQEGCEECRFHQNGNHKLCIFNVCPMEWEE